MIRGSIITSGLTTIASNREIQMLRPSWKLRTGMLAVAVTALLIGAAVMWSRASEFRQRAQDYAELEQRCRQMAASDRTLAASIRSGFESMRKRQREEREEMYATFRQELRRYANDPDPEGKTSRRIAEREAEMTRNAAEEETKLDRYSLTINRKAEEHLADAKMSSAWVLYHAGLRRKYERAASHPWESVPPDPPTPEPLPVYQPPRPSSLSPSALPNQADGEMNDP